MNHLKPRCIAVFILSFFIGEGFSDNPIVQNNYTADPAPMVYNDRVYLYTSHDDDETEAGFYTMRNYCCYSTGDMVNWTDHGIVATLDKFSWLNGHNNDAWAPQCVERNGKFYLYIPIHGRGIGVLVADNPAGPFRDPIEKPLIDRGNWSDIDPTVYIDSDGQAYMYWGNGSLWYVKLNDNMTSYSGDIVTIDPKPAGFTEGPWFYKRNSHYYMIYAGMGGGSENIQYAMSNSPTGPWTSQGIIMPHGNCFTNHPGVCDFKDNSYFFYHNATLPGGGTFKRSVCVEQFTYNDDGSIPAIAMTENGPEQIEDINPYDTVQAETICRQEGVETEICSEGGMNVSFIENGDYIKVKGVNFGNGPNLFEARVASNTDGGKIEMYIDDKNGTLIGTCGVANTGGWQEWVTKSCSVDNVTGTHDLYFVFTGGSDFLFNFNWWKFQTPTGIGADNVPVQRKSNNLSVVSKDARTIRFNYNGAEEFSSENLKIALFDLQGRIAVNQACTEKASKAASFIINRRLLRSGMYAIRIATGNKVLFNGSYMMY